MKNHVYQEEQLTVGREIQTDRSKVLVGLQREFEKRFNKGCAVLKSTCILTLSEWPTAEDPMPGVCQSTLIELFML